MNLRTQVLSGLRWRGGTLFLSQLCTWGLTLIVMRILSPADYGLFAMAGVFVAFLTLLSELGLGPAIVQKANIDDHKLRQIFGLSILTNTLLCLSLFISAPLIAKYYSEPRLVNIIRVLSFQFVCNSFIVIPYSILTKKLDFKQLSIIDGAGNIINGVATLTFALQGFGIWSLIIGNYVNVISKAIFINYIAPFCRMPSFSFAGLYSLVSYGGNVTLTRMLWFFYSECDVFIAGKTLGSQLLGFYSISMHLATLPLQKVSGILNTIAFPAFSTIQHDMELVCSHFLKAVRMLSVLAFPVLWGISSVAPELIIVFLGPKWAPSILPLKIVTMVMPLIMLNNIFYPLLQGIGRPDLPLKNVAWASLIMPLAFVCGSYYGLTGFSMAWVFAYPFVFISNLARLTRAIGLQSIGMVLKEILWPVVSSLVMYLVVAGLRSFVLDGIDERITLTIAVSSGIAIYCSCMLILDKKRASEFVGLFKH